MQLRLSQSAFTLIELLTVIAVISVLSALAFGISTGVKNSQARAKAKAELAVISQALEQFKAQNGDYPWVSGNPRNNEGNAQDLFKSLLGWTKFTRVAGKTIFEEKDIGDVAIGTGPKSFIDVSKLNYVVAGSEQSFNPDLGEPDRAPDDHVLLDPWGNPYVYLYGQNDRGDWEVFGYHLYSLGPDGLGGELGLDAVTGVIDADTFRNEADNLDNVYAGE